MIDIPANLPEIRPFHPDDLERVQAFFAQMGGESRAFFNRGSWNEKKALRFFSESDDIQRFMAVDGDRMVGYLFLWDWDKSVPWLGIAVAEDWKGRHLGRKLMRHARDHAILHGKGCILLTTHIANLRGQGLYERCGYQRLGMHESGEVLYLLRFDAK